MGKWTQFWNFQGQIESLVYMDTDIYRKFDKYCLLLQSYLCIAAVFVLTFGAAVLLSSPSAEAQSVYYLSRDQSATSPSRNWNSTDSWSLPSDYPTFYPDNAHPSGSYIPGSNNGAIYVVGYDVPGPNENDPPGIWLRTPNQGSGTSDTFLKNGSGADNWLYLGYELDSNGQPYIPQNAGNLAVLNVKCQTLMIN